MKTRLPADIIGESKTAELYQQLIATFDDKSYRARRSDLLGIHFLEQIAELNMQDDPTVRDSGQSKKSLSGGMFELLIAEMLIMHGIRPFYTQAEMWKVPMSKFDFLLYHETRPVILTCKLSLAERWRQASLEGMALKNIYRQGRCFLIAGDVPAVKPEIARAVHKRNRDVDDAQIDGIDRFYHVGSAELTELFNQLAEETFTLSEAVNPVAKFQRKVV